MARLAVMLALARFFGKVFDQNCDGVPSSLVDFASEAGQKSKRKLKNMISLGKPKKVKNKYHN